MIPFLLSIFLFINISLQGHGFGEGTPVKTAYRISRPIGQMFDIPSTNKEVVASYDFEHDKCVASEVYIVGRSQTNCFIRIWFDSACDSVIECAPTQEFYVLASDSWVTAANLKVGDKLLSRCSQLKPIKRIQFIKKPLEIFTLHIPKHQNFLVGKHEILTHNMLLELGSVGFSVAFGEGAAAGAATGSMFGPVVATATVIIAGLIGVGIRALSSDKRRVEYDVNFDAEGFGEYFNNKDKQRAQDKAEGQGAAGAGGSGGPQGGPQEGSGPNKGPEDPDDDKDEGPKDKKPDGDEESEFKDKYGIPHDWLKEPSKKGTGTKYTDPKNPHNSVRFMQGNPNSSNPAQQTSYVKQLNDGKAFDVTGSRVPPDSAEAHIPLGKFTFRTWK